MGPRGPRAYGLRPQLWLLSKSNHCQSNGHQECYFFYFIFVVLSLGDPQRSSEKFDR